MTFTILNVIHLYTNVSSYVCYSITNIRSLQILVDNFLYRQGYNGICYKNIKTSGEVVMEIFPAGNKTDIANHVSIEDQHECCYTCCLQVYFITDYAITTVDSIGQGCSVAPVVDNNVCY